MNKLNLYSQYIKKKFGERVQKISIDAGFSCPNRDGSKGVGGCTYCNNESFSSGNKSLSITDQLENGIAFWKARNRRLDKFIAYFQSYSNTYGDVRDLEKLYLRALRVPGIVGLSVSTRPDCIDDDKINLLADLSKDYHVTIEYGAESTSNTTLDRINRCHSVEDFEKALLKSKRRGLQVCGHFILGFPWETRDDVFRGAEKIGRYPLDFIKVHQLQVIKGTKLANEFKKAPFYLMAKDEYFEALALIVSHLSPDVVIQRLFSHYPKGYLVTDSWQDQVSILMDQFVAYLDETKREQGCLHVGLKT